MKKIPHFFMFAILLTVLNLLSCGSDTDLLIDTVLPDSCDECAPMNQVVNYTESTEDIFNPERGWCTSTITWASNYSTINKDLVLNKQYTKGYRGIYTVKSRLMRRVWVLDNFVNKPISQSFLDKIQNDLDALRAAGSKVMPHFSYTTDNSRIGNPPYGDASKATILEHIGQLAPILKLNSDIIPWMTQGFIGIYGEGIYSDHFGGPGTLTDKNIKDRNEVLQALLDATNLETQIGVRYPELHQKFVYGVDVGLDAAPLSDFSRVAMYNACFVSSKRDVGTYYSYTIGHENNNTTTIQQLRDYTSVSTNFVSNGGETCYNDPANSDTTCLVEDIEIMKFTWLNADYNNDLNNQWIDCIDDISKSLGYRYVLNSTKFPSELQASKTFNFALDIKNVGVAPIYSVRNLELIFRNKTTNDEIKVPFIGLDLRTLQGRASKIFNLYATAPDVTGDYDILLNIPDLHSSIANNVKYSVRLANMNTWEPSTGYNDLNQLLTIKK